MPVHKITPFLWFDGQAEEAVELYCRVFENARVTDTMRCGDAGPYPKGTVLTVSFEIENQHFTALNGGPMYRFTPAISFLVDCRDQAEVDRYWNGLVEGGKPSRCGWLEDRYGVTWQICPSVLMSLLQSPEPGVAQRVTAAMMTMVKLDIAELERAARG